MREDEDKIQKERSLKELTEKKKKRKGRDKRRSLIKTREV